MSELRHVGRPAPRPDGPDKAAGRALYIHDLTRPGMLYGKIRFSEHAHARIVAIDTSRARRLRGVRAVITGEDTPELRLGFLKDNVALKRGKVRQFRDEVAAVAAIDPDIAAEAVELIEVEYEPLEAVFTPDEALAPGAPLVHELDGAGRPMTGNRLPLEFRHVSGDLDQRRRAARWVVEGRYTTPRIQQACLGTAGCIAELDMSGNLTIWAKTQIPFLAQRDFRAALKALGLANRNVRVIVPALGGGFGTGLDTHAYEHIAILLAWKTGRPVKIVYSREEEFACLSPRQGSVARIVQGLDGSGRLAFRELEVIQDNGAYTSWGATYPSVMLLPVTSLYRVPAVRFTAQLVYTNNTYCQAMRGYGNPEATWPIESSLDELATEAGIDPLELRRLNCNQPGETTPMGLKVTTCGLERCLERTAELIGWSSRRGQGRALRRGVGLASLIHVGGGGRIYRSDGSGIILKLDDYGQVRVSHGGVEMGQGLETVIRQGVAEALGVRVADVHVNQTDTATSPWDVGTHASRGAFMALNAALMAAAKLRQRLFAWAETVYPEELERNRASHRERHPEAAPAPPLDLKTGATREGFELRDGMLRHASAPAEPWASVELGRFLRAVHFRDAGATFVEEAFYEPPSELPDWAQGKGNLSTSYVYGTQGVELEVDTETVQPRGRTCRRRPPVALRRAPR